MSEMRNPNRAADSPSRFSKSSRSHSSTLEIDFWMPSEVRAISPLVDRLMRLVGGYDCVRGAEFDVELALREALNNAVVHGNRGNPNTKVHVRCRCQPGKELSIVVTDQGKGFDFEKLAGIAIDPEAQHGRGVQLMKAYMDDMHFERGGSEVHLRKSLRTAPRS